MERYMLFSQNIKSGKRKNNTIYQNLISGLKFEHAWKIPISCNFQTSAANKVLYISADGCCTRFDIYFFMLYLF